LSWKCPKLIRDYDRLDKFTSEGRSGGQVYWVYGGEIEKARILGGPEPLLDSYLDRFREASGGIGGLIIIQDKHIIPDKKVGHAFHYVRSHMSQFFTPSRAFCGLFYPVSFTHTSVLVFQNIAPRA